MKKSDLKQLIKEVHDELNETYMQDQLSLAEKDHDWEYKMGVKFIGTKNSSKQLSLDKETFNKIKKILK